VFPSQSKLNRHLKLHEGTQADAKGFELFFPIEFSFQLPFKILSLASQERNALIAIFIFARAPNFASTVHGFTAIHSPSCATSLFDPSRLMEFAKFRAVRISLPKPNSPNIIVFAMVSFDVELLF
jgi:hypothetical protein